MLALARLGAIQNPMLPIYREREVGFVTRQAQSKLLVVPSTWRGFDFEAMAQGHRRRHQRRGRHASRCSSPTRPCRRATPPTLPAAARTRADDAVRWYFYTSGTTADPEGRPAHRPHDQGRRRRHVRAARGHRGRPQRGRVPVHPHRRHRLALQRPRRRVPHRVHRAVRPGQDHRRSSSEHGVTLAGAGTPFHMAYLAAQRQLPAGEVLFPSVRVYPGGGAPKPPQLHYDIKAEMGGVGIVSGYGLTEAPIIAMAAVRDTRRAARRHRGQGHRRHPAPHRHPRGQGGRHRRGGRDPRQGAAGDEGLPRRARSTPTPSTTTATSRPATSGGSTPRAWSRSPAG